MKDAEIIDKNSNSLSTDDLVLMIGEKEIWLRQKDKQIKALAKKVSELRNAGNKLETLEKSNKALSDKNIELDRALTEVRKEAKDLNAKVINLNSLIKEKETELQKAKENIAELEVKRVKHNKNKKRNRSKSPNS